MLSPPYGLIREVRHSGFIEAYPLSPGCIDPL